MKYGGRVLRVVVEGVVIIVINTYGDGIQLAEAIVKRLKILFSLLA